jgi:LemA protein
MLRLHWPRCAARPGAARAAALLGLPGCGYNEFQTLDEQVTAAWAEVLSQYQRRADLIPNIVATVKGEANFEQETLTKVIEARAKATSIQATPELVNDPERVRKFQQAQGELSSALSRLLVVTENYPNLKANQASRTCASSSKAPRTASPSRATSYIAAVQQYNTRCAACRPTSRR